jgi:hypothetical protein
MIKIVGAAAPVPGSRFGVQISAQDITNLKARILEAVEERWKAQQTPHLLSQLGKELGLELRAVMPGRKLKEIIEQDFKGTFRLEFDPTKLWYVVPVDAPPTDKLAMLTGTRPDVPKFQLPIWAAFRKSLSGGTRRFVARDDKGFHFMDIREGSPLPEAVFEVPEHAVCPPEMSSAEVAKRIRAFIVSSDLPLTDFLAKQTGVGESGQIVPLPGAERSQGSLLDALFAALAPADLRRISLPLDLVAKLRNRRRSPTSSSQAFRRTSMTRCVGCCGVSQVKMKGFGRLLCLSKGTIRRSIRPATCVGSWRRSPGKCHHGDRHRGA